MVETRADLSVPLPLPQATCDLVQRHEGADSTGREGAGSRESGASQGSGEGHKLQILKDKQRRAWQNAAGSVVLCTDRMCVQRLEKRGRRSHAVKRDEQG